MSFRSFETNGWLVCRCPTYPKIVYNLALNGDLQALRKWFNLQRKWGKELRWRDIMSCRKLKFDFLAFYYRKALGKVKA